MTMGRHLMRRSAALPGIWLAVLAAAGQVLLPFLLAFEIALAAPQVDAGPGAAFCSGAHGAAAAPATDRSGGGNHRVPPAGCPICQALAAGQGFTPSTPVALRFPTTSTVILQISTPSRAPTEIAAVPYRSRGPPSSV